jgi:uncharacterized protein YcbX
MPFVETLITYPIKSLDGVHVSQSRITAGGALEHDREFALLDERGNYVNGKRHASVHQIRAVFDEQFKSVALSSPAATGTATFNLIDDVEELEAWFGSYFGFPIKVRRDTTNGFPDDTVAPGPTVISTGTLEEISRWFAGLNVRDVLRRFRVNLVISGVPSFWEDGLFGAAGVEREFKVGVVRMAGINPCQRCVVPSRDPLTGEEIPGFQKYFVSKRRATMPDWITSSRFDHYYRLCVNTRIPLSEVGKTICVGDEIELTSTS